MITRNIFVYWYRVMSLLTIITKGTSGCVQWIYEVILYYIFFLFVDVMPTKFSVAFLFYNPCCRFFMHIFKTKYKAYFCISAFKLKWTEPVLFYRNMFFLEFPKKIKSLDKVLLSANQGEFDARAKAKLSSSFGISNAKRH